MDSTQDIITLFNQVETKGEYFHYDTKDFLLPGLEVEGVGSIGLPLTEAGAKQLIGVARKAPFGKGTDTVWDTEVRNTWEIDARQLKLKNPAFQERVQEILEEVKQGLGIPEKHQITAELYKLLLYEEGSFFLPHQDSEKEPGMFGTLVLSLPAEYRGGTFRLRFREKEAEVSFSEAERLYRLSYIAFYADCEHEIKPITEGYRLTLVYNLVRQDRGGDSLSAARQDATIHQIADKLKALTEDYPHEQTNASPAYILFLEHQYTPTNFGLQALKGRDVWRVQAFREAAQKAGFYIRLALFTHHLSGASYAYYGYGDSEPEDFEIDELIEEETYLQNWEAQPQPPLISYDIEEQYHILNARETDAGEPHESDNSGYTGNAGVTVDYWYHHGVLIFWSKAQHAALLAQLDTDSLVEWLEYYFRHWESENGEQVVRELFKHLDEQAFTPGFHAKENPALAATFLKLNDEAFFRQHAPTHLFHAFTHIPDESWRKLDQHFAPESLCLLFERVREEGNTDQRTKLYTLLAQLMRPAYEAEGRKALEEAKAHFTHIFEVYGKEGSFGYVHGFNQNKLSPKGQKLLDSLEGALTIAHLKDEDPSWRKELMAFLVTHDDIQTIDFIYGGALLRQPKAARDNQLYQALYNFVTTHLQQRIKHEPQPPKDWRRSFPKDGDKAVWDILADFMNSPTKKTFAYQKAQADRSRMENAVRNAQADLKMETLKTRPAHTLKLTKTQDSYQRKHQQWQAEVSLLEQLRKLD